jgi:hypothetical protein
MGEVYRAEDLRLRQTVALKFLPERLAQNPDALSRFHQEVRLARQISHPNVCRVFDIQEAEGRPFLAMEYIDGEDLAALLRRIGRLPVDKGLEIAKQLCAGLAAIHDSGVLHRDLKPANVMIDARGRARITDFGISALAEDEGGGPARRIGTPAYMAPEQLAGGEATVRTDLYALGLILYEVLTGQKPFPASTLREVLERQGEKKPIPPSALVREIDPRTDRALLQCLQRDPGSRPASALAVAAALPGLDPLAAALAAGETPSPEMVAAAPAEGGLRPAHAMACLVAVVLLSAHLGFVMRVFDVSWVPLQRSPEVMAERAREILSRLGHESPPAARASWYAYHIPNHDHQGFLLRSGRIREARELARGRAPLTVFVYRESPRSLLPLGPVLSGEDPPLDEPGEVFVFLDTQGRLLMLVVVPYERENPRASPAGGWEALFSVADLDPKDFAPTKPVSIPPFFADRRQAWIGAVQDPPRQPVPLRIEAASYRGLPVYFNRTELWPERAWVETGRRPSIGRRVLKSLYYFFYLTVAIGGVFLAHRHWRLRRGDVTGTFRLASIAFLLQMGTSLVTAGSLGSLADDQFWISAIGRALTQAGLVWVCYMALEPILRRTWPERVISWSRLLGGHPRDPVVGRDLLVGCVLGLGTGAVFSGRALIQFAFTGGSQGGPPYAWISGMSHFVPRLLEIAMAALLTPLCFLVFLFALRLLLRRWWAATLMLGFLLTVVLYLRGHMSITNSPPSSAVSALFGLTAAVAASLFILAWTRFGLLTGIAQWLILYLVDGLWLLSDLSSWHTGRGLFAGLVIFGLAVYGFAVSTAGQRWFRDEILEV